jgi:hypothetical protein
MNTYQKYISGVARSIAGTPGSNRRTEQDFSAFEREKSVVLRPLDYTNRNPEHDYDPVINPLRVSAALIYSRHHELEDGGKMHIPAVVKKLVAGTALCYSQVVSTQQTMPRGFTIVHEGRSVITTQYPNQTRQEWVSRMTGIPAREVDDTLFFSLDDLNTFVESHERFHSANFRMWRAQHSQRIQPRSLYWDDQKSPEQALLRKLADTTPGEPYVEFLDECVSDTASCLYALKRGADPQFPQMVGQLRLAGAYLVGDSVHFTTPAIKGLLPVVEQLQQAEMLKDLTLEEIHDLAMEVTARHAPNRQEFYAMAFAVVENKMCAKEPLTEVEARVMAVIQGDPVMKTDEMGHLVGRYCTTLRRVGPAAAQNFRREPEHEKTVRLGAQNDFEALLTEEAATLLYQKNEYPDLDDTYLLQLKLRTLEGAGQSGANSSRYRAVKMLLEERMKLAHSAEEEKPLPQVLER